MALMKVIINIQYFSCPQNEDNLNSMIVIKNTTIL